jgi:predicted nucleic acid-binding protein
MIVLDTNVISELMRVAPDARVAACLRARPAEELVTTSISVAEILYGLRCLPMGRRRSDLEVSFGELMRRGLRERLLPFDEAAADVYSGIMAERRRAGRPTGSIDAMIAAIALSRGASVATRNIQHFSDCGIELVDPWAWPDQNA